MALRSANLDLMLRLSNTNAWESILGSCLVLRGERLPLDALHGGGEAKPRAQSQERRSRPRRVAESLDSGHGGGSKTPPLDRVRAPQHPPSLPQALRNSSPASGRACVPRALGCSAARRRGILVPYVRQSSRSRFTWHPLRAKRLSVVIHPRRQVHVAYVPPPCAPTRSLPRASPGMPRRSVP